MATSDINVKTLETARTVATAGAQSKESGQECPLPGRGKNVLPTSYILWGYDVATHVTIIECHQNLP